MARQDYQEQDYYEEVAQEQPQDLLQTIFVASPPWLFSGVVHLVLMLILLSIAWDSSPREPATIAADLREQELREELKPEEPEQVVFDEEPMIHDPRLPPADVVFVPEVMMDQPEIDVPGFNLFDPDDDPPLAVEVLSLGDKGASGHFHGVYGARGGAGRRRSLLRGGGSRASEEAVNDGLAWLARVQEPDGSWDSRKWGAGRDCDAGVTGLALLAFLGNGQTDREGRYRDNVRRALEYLEYRQQANGFFGERYYTQGICTMAVSEAYGLTRNPRWRAVAQKAVDNVVRNQNPNGGWDYMGSNAARVDTSVTGWNILGVKSAIASGLHVASDDIERIKKWCREVVNPGGGAGYTKKIGEQGSSNTTPAMTSLLLISQMFFGWEIEELQQPLEFLHGRGVNINDLYYLYYGTLTMFQAGGRFWEQWNTQMRDPLIARQVKGRGPEFDGSWEPDACRWGRHGGRVYTTAMAVLCLEVYYRYLPILR